MVSTADFGYVKPLETLEWFLLWSKPAEYNFAQRERENNSWYDKREHNVENRLQEDVLFKSS